MHYKAQKSIFIFACLFLTIIFQSYSHILPKDSVGIEKQGNKTFILHQVDPKETLFSLAKRYNVKVSAIETENPEVKSGIKVGQIIKIPYLPKTSSASSSNPNASSGAKTHTVEIGQTLYSISRLYNVSVEDIKRWNNLETNELSAGREIIVSAPGKGALTQDTANRASKAPVNKSITETKAGEVSHTPNFKYDSKGNKVHIAEPGQTLFLISNIYNVSIEDVKKWNNVGNNEISTGQEIIVAKAKEKEAVSPAKERLPDSVINKTANNNNNITNSATRNEQTRSEQPRLESYAPESIKNSHTSSNFNKVIERGLAEAIDESSNNPKFLALHKTASVGTIIQVKNELNNLYIFARVIGKLPETGSNDRLVIKLSQKAYDKLGAVDKRFPVEVSYVPSN